MDTITDRQLSFLTSLREERGISLAGVSQLTKRQASDEIAELLKTPRPGKKPAAQAAKAFHTDLPAGRYAVVPHDDVVFVQIDRPTKGRFAGRIFVATLHGENKKNVYGAERAALVQAIEAEGVEACVRRYAHHRNECGFCRQSLTDQFSRFYGVGPVCARRHGLPFSFASYLKANPAEEAQVAAWVAEDVATHMPEDDPIATSIAWKNAHAAQERVEEEAAYLAKMRRDEQLFNDNNPAH